MKKVTAGIVILICIITSVYSNDGFTHYNPLTGTIIPDNTNDIQMVSEKVQYFYENEQFRTEFIFRNISNDPITFSTVFPIYKSERGDDQINPEEINFKTWIDGVEVESSFQEVSLPAISNEILDAFITNEIFIDSNQEIFVIHEYSQKPAVYSYSNVGESSYYYNYIVTTGASWAGVIEKGVFEFHIPREIKISDEDFSESYTGLGSWNGIRRVDYHFQPGQPTVLETQNELIFRWELTNYEPDTNIEIEIEIFGTPSWVTSPDRCYSAVTSLSEVLIEMFEYDLRKFGLSNEEYLDLVHKWIIYKYQEYIKGKQSELEKTQNACQLYINFMYATKGYTFNSPTWTSGFSLFSWYHPKPNDQIVFSESENEKLRKIVEIRDDLSQ